MAAAEPTQEDVRTPVVEGPAAAGALTVSAEIVSLRDPRAGRRQ